MGNKQVLEKLKSIIGDKAYSEVCRLMSGEQIRIPVYLVEYTDKATRDAAIRRAFYRGSDPRTLAEEYALSLSQIYKILE